MEDPKYKTITITGFMGQRPEGMASEWWTDEDWKKWDKHIEELKASGEYGKPFESTLNILPFPLFDGPEFILDTKNFESHTFIPYKPQ